MWKQKMKQEMKTYKMQRDMPPPFRPVVSSVREETFSTQNEGVSVSRIFHEYDIYE